MTNQRPEQHSNGSAWNLFLAIVGGSVIVALFQFVTHASSDVLAFVGGIAITLLVAGLLLVVGLVYVRRQNFRIQDLEIKLQQTQQALINRGQNPYGSPTQPNVLVIDPSTFNPGRRSSPPTYRTDLPRQGNNGYTWDPDGYSQADGV